MEIVTILGYILLVLLMAGTILVILSDEDGDSGKKIAWIIVVVMLPVIGMVSYLVFGLNPRLNSKYMEYSRRFHDSFSELSDARSYRRLFGENNKDKIREGYRELSVLLSHSNGTTVTDNNNVEIITSGKRKFEALVSDLESAKDHIHMEYFYFRKDNGSKRIKEILMKKAREGVKVRFIHENIANIDINPGYYNEMKKAG
ncbi:MAG TPA: PLDc N-terminal domain-containing protein, partial [Candidatus Cryptobacteroides intestinipullorum]|nr:PLDc N-terminal domain-containing protein [Candidatus Cryptobacteroides intestinipullorum]